MVDGGPIDLVGLGSVEGNSGTTGLNLGLSPVGVDRGPMDVVRCAERRERKNASIYEFDKDSAAAQVVTYMLVNKV